MVNRTIREMTDKERQRSRERQKANSRESRFEIESLDPAERSWYYDGDGTQRLKD